MRYPGFAFLASLLFLLFAWQEACAAVVNYDIVYVRAPRYGDTKIADWPEVFNPTKMEPGADLVLLKPDGSEDVLFAAGNGAVIDPAVSFDAQWVYFAYFPDVRPAARNYQRDGAPIQGSDIYKIHLPTRQVVRLTQQNWVPPSGGIKWSTNHLEASSPDAHYLGYGIFNMAPCPLPGGKVMFVSSRDGYLPNKTYTFPNLRLYVMDDNGRNVEKVGHLNIGSAMHPTILKDGRVMFSSYESQGLRDQRVWSLWSILPDGRYWEPLMGSFKVGSSMHFQTQLSDGRISVVEYYNLNNEGFGTLLSFAEEAPAGASLFGSANALDLTNPKVQRGIDFFQPGHPAHLQPRFTQYRFSPPGLNALTAFTHGEDQAAPPIPGATAREQWAGKVTHPSAVPNNDVLIVYSAGPVNNLNRPASLPRIDGGIYLLKNGVSIDDPSKLVMIKNDPNFNEQFPRAVVPYAAIHGVSEPDNIPWLPNDGREHAMLPAGTPFGIIGTSTFYRRDTKPGNFEYITPSVAFDGWDKFNTSENDENPNWSNQGADAGKYANDDIYAVRIVGMEATAHRSYGPKEGAGFKAHQGRERLRILGEIPLKKKDANGNTVLDTDGNPDTSFMAKIPADTPFTFQTIDKRGLVLNVSQTWHQVRPGEVRNDCGGCHAHAQPQLDIAKTAAGKAEYVPHDLTKQTPILTRTSLGETLSKFHSKHVLDVEYHRDIKPILQRSCVACHTRANPAGNLALDDDSIVNGFDNTYNRLADDADAKYGHKPVISNKTWRGTNASRYVRSFQSRRSLLMWKIFGERLDGWTNASHPTESVPGDASTLPAGADANLADLDFTGTIMPPPGSNVPGLSEDEKMMFARWIDLGAPVDSSDAALAQYGWFNDEQSPTLTVSLPAGGASNKPVKEIRIGAFDNYSGLDRNSLSVKASFEVNSKPAGAELAGDLLESADHVWTIRLAQYFSAGSGVLTVSVKDKRGNESAVTRSFTVVAAREGK
jgi:Hydrazine synthase alpha subunit middle domain